MPKVIFDYNKCDGQGECIDACPVDILELSDNGHWCKPIDDKVENQEAVEKFQDEVEEDENPVDAVIKNEMPECVACRVCVTACPNDAISIEP